MRTQSYPSDINDAQWALIEPYLPVSSGGRPRTTDLRDVVDAILYIRRTDCQWRYLPQDFPPKRNVLRYFEERRDKRTPGANPHAPPRQGPTAAKPYAPPGPAR